MRRPRAFTVQRGRGGIDVPLAGVLGHLQGPGSRPFLLTPSGGGCERLPQDGPRNGGQGHQWGQMKTTCFDIWRGRSQQGTGDCQLSCHQAQCWALSKWQLHLNKDTNGIYLTGLLRELGVKAHVLFFCFFLEHHTVLWLIKVTDTVLMEFPV